MPARTEDLIQAQSNCHLDVIPGDGFTKSDKAEAFSYTQLTVSTNGYRHLCANSYMTVTSVIPQLFVRCFLPRIQFECILAHRRSKTFSPAPHLKAQHTLWRTWPGDCRENERLRLLLRQ